MASTKHRPGCPCCSGGGCPVTLTVNARCSGIAVTGTLIELLNAAGTTVLDSGTGSSKVFTIDGTTAYNYRVSKAGYCTKTYALPATGCVTSTTKTANLWPSTYNLSVTVSLNFSCLLPGATVSITGDATGSGTTNGSGVAVIALTSLCTAQSQAITITVTPPSGTGADPSVTATTVDPCGNLSRLVILPPNATHANCICNHRYLPITLDWSDDYGTCTFTSGGACTYTTAGYTYVTPNGIKTVSCGVTSKCIPNQTVTVKVDFGLTFTRNCSGSASFEVVRSISRTSATDCFGGSFACQPSDVICNTHPGQGSLATGSMDCSTTTLSWTGAIPAITGIFDSCAGDWPETAVTGTLTGTI